MNTYALTITAPYADDITYALRAPTPDRTALLNAIRAALVDLHDDPAVTLLIDDALADHAAVVVAITDYDPLIHDDLALDIIDV